MTHLNSLAFVAVPKNSGLSPTLIRRYRLVERLEEQKLLASNPSYIPVSKRWKKTPDGSKSLVDHYRRISPWWRVEESGNLVLTIKVGLKKLEFEKGKTGIAVGAPERLESVLDTLLAATRAGELDRFLEPPKDSQRQSVPKVRKVA